MRNRSRLLLLLLLLAPEIAQAKRLAIFDLRWSGVPPTLQTQVTDRLAQTLRGLGYKVRKLPAAADSPILPGCNMGPCVVAAGRTLKIDRALFGGIAAVGSSYDVTLTLVETVSGNRLAQVTNRCDVCTFAEAAEATAEAARQLHTRAAEFEAAQGWLDIASDPPGYQIAIDGVPRGVTPLRQMVSPGKHRLAANRAGQPTQETTVVVDAGETKRIRFGQQIEGGEADSTGALRVPNMSWGTWTLLGMSTALFAAGGTLWGVAEDSSQRTAGIALTSAGGAALAAFAVIFVERMLDRRPPSNPTPTHAALPPRFAVGASPGAVALFCSGSF